MMLRAYNRTMNTTGCPLYSGQTPSCTLSAASQCRGVQGNDAGGIFTASDQLVSRSGQCQEVEDILTDTPDPDSSLGNFTQQPTVEMLQACSGNSSAAILNGAALADALALTSPAFKVRTSIGTHVSSLVPFVILFEPPCHVQCKFVWGGVPSFRPPLVRGYEGCLLYTSPSPRD